MCGRYILVKDPYSTQAHELLNRAWQGSFSPSIKTEGELFPGDTLPVLAFSKLLKPRLFAMEWGFSLQGKRIINARFETASEKAMFRDGMLHRRCLIPASYYYEWNHSSAKREKYAIRPQKEGIFFLAGLYRQTASVPEFVILTRTPSPEIAFIHSRMPVIIDPQYQNDWMNPYQRLRDMDSFMVTSMDYALA